MSHYCRPPMAFFGARDGKTWRCKKCGAVFTYRAKMKAWLLTRDGRKGL